MAFATSIVPPVPARLFLLPALADIYHREGITGEDNQHITHMAHDVMVFTLSRNIITVVSTGSSPRSKALPLGNALKSCCQIHVYAERTPQRIEYTLAKHPRLPVRRATRWKEGARFGTTLPLECFFGDSD